MIRHDRFGYLIDYVLKNYKGKIVGHNLLGFDDHVFRNTGYSGLPSDLEDTLMLSKVIDSSRLSHGLKDLSEMYLGPEAVQPAKMLDEAMHLHGYKTKGDVLGQLDPECDAYLSYAAADVVLVAKLFPVMTKEVAPWRSVYEMEMGAWRVVSDIEHNGLYVDIPWAQQMHDEFTQTIDALAEQIKAYGIEKPRSAVQRIETLMEEGWEPEEFTDTGRAKLDKKILEGLDYAVVPLLLEHARLEKWRKAYVESVLTEHVGEKIYPRYNPFGAITGRQSVSNPPIQQIPSHDADAWKMRRMVLARPGEVLYGCDYDSQENRLLASFSGDEILSRMIIEGADIHTYTASHVFQKPESEVTKEERNQAKTLVYATQYGAGIKKVAKILGCGLDEAQEVRERMRQAFPQAESWKEQVVERGKERFVCEDGAYVETLLGRRVYARPPKGAPYPKYYTLVNFKIQSTGGELLKMSLNRIAAAGLGEYLYMLHHDEVQVSVPPGDGGEGIVREIKEIMSSSVEFPVPMTVGSSNPSKWWTK